MVVTGSFSYSRLTGRGQCAGFYLGGSQVLDIYGIDLGFVDGILSGHLRDGSYIDVAVELDGGQMNIYNIPEPSTILLLGIGLAGLSLVRRSKKS